MTPPLSVPAPTDRLLAPDCDTATRRSAEKINFSSEGVLKRFRFCLSDEAGATRPANQCGKSLKVPFLPLETGLHTGIQEGTAAKTAALEKVPFLLFLKRRQLVPDRKAAARGRQLGPEKVSISTLKVETVSSRKSRQSGDRFVLKLDRLHGCDSFSACDRPKNFDLNVAVVGTAANPVVGRAGDRQEIQRIVDTMATTGNRGGGQRSKGNRKFVGTRIPASSADLLPAAAAKEGMPNVSEWVASVIDEKLKSMDLTDLKLQEELPIGQIAS
jgi:hypothetical protein